MLRAANRRKHNDFAAQGALHGAKIPFMHNRELEAAQEPVSEFDEAQAQRALEEAQLRVRKRYGR